VRQLGELADVAGHRFAALRVERLDAVLLDLALVVEAQLGLDGELDGQAVAVPAAAPVDAVALHRLEAREDVLERAGLDVVRAGRAVGGGRALVEVPVRAVCGGLPRLGEDVAFVPQRQHAPVERGQVELRRHGGIRVLLLVRCGHVVPRPSSMKGRAPWTIVARGPAVPPLLGCLRARRPRFVGVHRRF